MAKFTFSNFRKGLNNFFDNSNYPLDGSSPDSRNCLYHPKGYLLKRGGIGDGLYNSPGGGGTTHNAAILEQDTPTNPITNWHFDDPTAFTGWTAYGSAASIAKDTTEQHADKFAAGGTNDGMYQTLGDANGSYFYSHLVGTLYLNARAKVNGGTGKILISLSDSGDVRYDPYLEIKSFTNTSYTELTERVSYDFRYQANVITQAAAQIVSAYLKGFSAANTDSGTLYGRINLVGSDRTVFLYSDSARTALVCSGSITTAAGFIELSDDFGFTEINYTGLEDFTINIADYTNYIFQNSTARPQIMLKVTAGNYFYIDSISVTPSDNSEELLEDTFIFYEDSSYIPKIFSHKNNADVYFNRGGLLRGYAEQYDRLILNLQYQSTDSGQIKRELMFLGIGTIFRMNADGFSPVPSKFPADWNVIGGAETCIQNLPKYWASWASGQSFKLIGYNSDKWPGRWWWNKTSGAFTDLFEWYNATEEYFGFDTGGFADAGNVKVPILGHAFYRSSLLLFKEKSTYVVKCDSAGYYYDQVLDVGCKNNKAIVEAEGNVYFFDVDGIYKIINYNKANDKDIGFENISKFRIPSVVNDIDYTKSIIGTFIKKLRKIVWSYYSLANSKYRFIEYDIDQDSFNIWSFGSYLGTPVNILCKNDGKTCSIFTANTSNNNFELNPTTRKTYDSSTTTPMVTEGKSIDFSWKSPILPIEKNTRNLFSNLCILYNCLSTNAVYCVDPNNKLSPTTNLTITGCTGLNSDSGILYLKFTKDGTNYIIGAYKSSGMAAADLVAETAVFTTTGIKNLVEKNSSGLSGTIKVVSLAASTYTTAYIEVIIYPFTITIDRNPLLNDENITSANRYIRIRDKVEVGDGSTWTTTSSVQRFLMGDISGTYINTNSELTRKLFKHSIIGTSKALQVTLSDNRHLSDFVIFPESSIEIKPLGY